MPRILAADLHTDVRDCRSVCLTWEKSNNTSHCSESMLDDRGPTRAGKLTTDDVRTVVGGRVRQFRVGLGLTMERFADLADVSLGMLSKIEHGQTSPSLSTLTNLANPARTAATHRAGAGHDQRARRGISPLSARRRGAVKYPMALPRSSTYRSSSSHSRCTRFKTRRQGREGAHRVAEEGEIPRTGHDTCRRIYPHLAVV